MENGEVKIPVSFEILGNKVDVTRNEPILSDNNYLGLCRFSMNNITIATIDSKGKAFPEDTVKHTYWHETAHMILHAMGEAELRDNEKFVDLLGGMIYQVLKTSVYDDNRENKRSTRINKRANKRS